MQLILKTIGGDSAGKKILLRCGQVASVGRTDWADFCVPDDPSMAEFHFEVSCEANKCTLTDRDGNGVKIEGEPVTMSDLKSGQRIEAGSTLFEVEIIGEIAEPAACCSGHGQVHETNNDESPVDVATSAPEMPMEPSPTTVEEYCEVLELGDAAKAAVNEQQLASPFDLLETLIRDDHFPDALCLTAGLLPKRDAILWGIECLRSGERKLTDADQAAAAAVDEWLAEPSEANRRAAEAVAKANEYDGPFSWLAMAVFWSEGSMSPEGQPGVAPLWQLTAKGVIAALTLAATKDPKNAYSHYASFIQASQERLAAVAS